MDAKGAKKSVKIWATKFYKSLNKCYFLCMKCGLSKIRSVHTYVIHRMVYFERNCILESSLFDWHRKVKSFHCLLMPAFNWIINDHWNCLPIGMVKNYVYRVIHDINIFLLFWPKKYPMIAKDLFFHMMSKCYQKCHSYY